MTLVNNEKYLYLSLSASALSPSAVKVTTNTDLYDLWEASSNILQFEVKAMKSGVIPSQVCHQLLHVASSLCTALIKQSLVLLYKPRSNIISLFSASPVRAGFFWVNQCGKLFEYSNACSPPPASAPALWSPLCCDCSPNPACFPAASAPYCHTSSPGKYHSFILKETQQGKLNH